MKKMTQKILSILLAVMLLLSAFSLAACIKLPKNGDETQKTSENDSTGQEDLMFAEKLVKEYGAKLDERWTSMDGNAYVDWYVITESSYLEDGSLVFDFSIDVPVIGVNGDETILQAIGADVLHQAVKGRSRYYRDPAEIDKGNVFPSWFYIKRQGGNYLSDCAPTFHKEGNIISLTLEVDTYSPGAAHGSQQVISYNADVSREGDPLLKFGDIFVDEAALSRLSGLCGTYVSEWTSFVPNMGYEENVEKNYPKTLEEEPIFSWAIIDTGIRFVFPEYSIASYADGAPIFRVPNSELDGIIKNEFLPDN